MEIKLGNGKNIESQYNRILALFYGDHVKMIYSIQRRIDKYNKSKNAKKVSERIKSLNQLLKYAIMTNDLSMSDHLRQEKFLSNERI